MAAIYSGIHLKLKSPQTPWEDKLKLARFAWISSQCLLPNKEQVLLDWCTHALTGWYNQKVEFSQNVLEGLWCYLDDLLHSRKLHSFLRQGKTISLRLNMAQLLLERLQECSRVDSKSPVCAATILSVCQGILSSPVLSSVFITKYELMVDLLAKLCSMACCELQQPLLTEIIMTESDTCQDVVMSEPLQTQRANNKDTLDSPADHPELDTKNPTSKPRENHSSNLFEVLLQVLSCYLAVQRQQANPNRVFTVVTNQLIQPLVLLRHLLTSGDIAPTQTLRIRQQLCRDIRVKIDSILQSALFPSEHLTSYKDELLPSRGDTGKRGPGGAKGPLKPVSAILPKLSAQGYCEPPLHYSVKSNTLSLLFKFFLESYGKGRGDNEEEQKMLCFYFLMRLVPALDLSLDGDSVSPAKAEQSVSESSGQTSSPDSLQSPESWSLALLSVEFLLSQALSADIYNVAADRIRHKQVQLNFYRALGQMLFNQAQPSIPAWYRCLKVLLSLNHLILEPDLDQLLSSAWVNSECMEARVQRARQMMVCSLLQTYTKLRQLPRLFSELLSVICQPALEELRPPLLSEGISVSLGTCLLDTPPSQCFEICSSVLENMRTHILPDMVKDEKEAEKMDIDEGGDDKKSKLNVDQERQDASLKLFSLSQLLHAVLFSLKTLDNASPLPLVRQGQALMEEMQQVVKELLQVLPREQRIKKTPRKVKKKVEHKEPEGVSVLWEQKTQEATLLLRYAWVEVDTLFNIHCSKYISPDSDQEAAVHDTEEEALSNAPVHTRIESLLSGDILPAHLYPSPSCSPMSCLLLKLLTLQQMKRVMLDCTSACESSTAALLNRAAHFISAKLKLEETPGGEQVWDGQISSVDSSSYIVAHWHLVASNLPLIYPYLSGEDLGCIADVLVGSLLREQSDGGMDCPPSCLTISLISSQLLESLIFPELPSLYSATVCSLAQRIYSVLLVAHAPKVCATLPKIQEEGSDASPSSAKLVEKETIVEDILASSKTGDVFVSLSDSQTKELVNLIQILTHLNPNAMNSEDLGSVFLLLFMMLTSASRQSDGRPDSEENAVFQVKLLRILTSLVESRNLKSVLKLFHAGSLLQAAVSSLLWHSNSGRYRATHSSDWMDLIKAVQDFIRALVQLIIFRNSSVQLNLNQFIAFLTSKEKPSGCNVAQSSAAVSGKPDPGASILSVHLELASLTSFAQEMTSNLGRSKLMDQTLTQMVTTVNATLGPAVESVLRPQTVSEAAVQPVGVLDQAFVVEVVTVMLHCELSSLSVEEQNKQDGTTLTLSHMTLYQNLCQQILRELNSDLRPMDSLVSYLHFLSLFYKAAERMRGDKEKGEKDLDELYTQILQNVQRLLTAPWLSPKDVCELEPAVQELLCHLVEKSTTAQFKLLLLMIREGLNTGKLRAGNYREVLSAVTITKLLFCCQLTDPCMKALWHIAPQIISAMVFLLRSSGLDTSLTLPFTVPTVTSMTSLLRQGEGFITNPHHVVLVLGALQSVPLDHLSPPVYQSAFLAIHEALFAIIQCHPQVLSNAAPSFLNVFYRLVASIMQEGRQRGDSDTGSDGDVYHQCSRLTQRMFSHIAAAAESFTTLSAFMVAQYVTELQKVTLRPDIKLHLTEGIYQIMDLCMEQDIKFLMAGLQMGVREVFNELYGSYTHYHKAERQGEEKYTV
nr:PREDICTED: unhealthy ribosome biogenesis protein 2 homolog [Paralichthys olivaceus]XP_019954339.1 PREDICTED: unhealthy ribosome biogenesis protein 2 homolog [Paralichthys olivaceus]XP_019954340.1 PREDICTED: unhealthy ribosome biogenesis protein 2 homolog [Paralichthys olivaceus]XP_019954341.1 PREDICTED: unhealthy ribosome biogenesis protein 2 homolog [Paralichthys olivaceus]XP_019954342.1 PREDICTED: unhealthy ribosome biogenesis protein 2 homolog [Paralichthys olivaceus]XP_019954343.1 PREDI